MQAETPIPPQKTVNQPPPSPENYTFQEGFYAQENVDPAVTKSLQIITKMCLYAFIGAFVVSILFFAWWGLKDYFVFGDKKYTFVALSLQTSIALGFEKIFRGR